jgi:hypothetical protein
MAFGRKGTYGVVTLIFVFAAMLLFAAPAWTQEISFEPQPNGRLFPAGPGPIDVATADFDEDGTLDLAVPDRFGGGNDDISVLLGNGDCSFAPLEPFLAGTSTFSIDTGDFDNDNNADLVVTDRDSGTANNVAVLLGNGDGSFDPPEFSGSGGTFPSDVAVGDFNEDGFDDLAVTNQTSNNIAILISDGDGTFAGPVLIAQTGSPDAADVGNFNGDGNLDIVRANGDADTATVFFGTGTGDFVRGPDVDVDSVPGHVIAADFNEDGDLDFATSNFEGDSVTVVLGNGEGEFSSAGTFDTQESPYNITVGDYNLDGDLDIAATNQFARTGGGEGNDKGSVSVLLGKGNGKFEDQQIFDVGDGPTGIVTVDCNDDDKPDLAISNFGAGDTDTTDTVSVGRNASQDSGGGGNGGDFGGVEEDIFADPFDGDSSSSFFNRDTSQEQQYIFAEDALRPAPQQEEEQDIAVDDRGFGSTPNGVSDFDEEDPAPVWEVEPDFRDVADEAAVSGMADERARDDMLGIGMENIIGTDGVSDREGVELPGDIGEEDGDATPGGYDGSGIAGGLDLDQNGVFDQIEINPDISDGEEGYTYDEDGDEDEDGPVSATSEDGQAEASTPGATARAGGDQDDLEPVTEVPDDVEDEIPSGLLPNTDGFSLVVLALTTTLSVGGLLAFWAAVLRRAEV